MKRSSKAIGSVAGGAAEATAKDVSPARRARLVILNGIMGAAGLMRESPKGWSEP